MPRLLLNLPDATLRRVFTDHDIARLASLGEVVRFDPKTDGDARWRELLQSTDAMLTCWGSRGLTGTDLPLLRRDGGYLVAHAAGSVRGVMSKELLDNTGVRLTQGAAAVAVAVSQYTVGLIILALRQAVHRSSVLRGGERASDGVYSDLTDATVGLIGLSRVGAGVVPLLEPFGCRIVAHDPYCSMEQAANRGVSLLSLDELLETSDAVSLHVPATPETEGLIDARRVGLLRQGSVFINTARARSVNQDALFARALAGEIEYYTDVTDPEPLPPTHPAWQSGHIFITPHIAGPTRQTLRRMALYAIEELERFAAGHPLVHEVLHDRYDLLA